MAFTSSGFDYSLSPSLTVTNTAVEQTVFTVPIKGGTLSNYKNLSFVMYCHLTSGLVAPTITVNVKYGTGTLAVISGLAVSVSQTNKPFTLDGILVNQSSTSSQYCFGLVKQSMVTGPLPLSSPNYDAYTNFAIDSTTDQNLSVSVKFGTAVVGTTLVVDYWRVYGNL